MTTQPEPRHVAPSLATAANLLAFALLLAAGPAYRTASAQVYASQDGRLLDANPRVGSMGLNSDARLDALVPRAQLYVTGNVTGGGRFQGLVPYRSTLEFGASLGSSYLSNFQRDSTGLSDLQAGWTAPRPYVNPSSAITRYYGGSVVRTDVLNRLSSAAPAPLASRPLERSDLSLSLPGLGDPRGLFPYAAPASMPPWMFAPQPSPLETPALLQPGQRSLTPDLQPQDRRVQPVEPLTPGQEPGQTSPESASPEGTALETGLPALSPNPVTSPTAAWGPPGPPTEASPDSRGALSRTPVPFGPAAQQQTRSSAQSDVLLPHPVANLSPADLAEQRRQFDAYNRQRYEFHLQRGEDLFRQFQYYRAADAFSAAGIYDLTAAPAYLGKAQALCAAGEFMSAAFFLAQAFELDAGLAVAPAAPHQWFSDQAKFQQRLDELNDYAQRSARAELAFLQAYLLAHADAVVQARDLLHNALRQQPQMKAAQTLLQALDTPGGADTPKGTEP